MFLETSVMFLDKALKACCVNIGWKQRMCNEPFGRAKKKKMVVAIARRFAVDWWRMNIGQVTAEELGLKTSYPSSLLRRLPAESFETL